MSRSSSAGAEEDFDGVVVDRGGQLHRVLLPRCRHHLQNLSGWDKYKINVLVTKM